MVRLASILVLAGSIIAAGQAGTTPKPDVRPQDPGSGRVSGNLYTNDFFGLSYPLPEGFYDNTSGALAQQSDTSHLEGVSYLLVADRHTGTPVKNRILIIADDRSHYQPSLTTKEYAIKLVRAFTQKGAEPVGDGAPAEFGERQFYRIDYKQNSEGTTLYKSFVCTEIRGYFLSWTVATPSNTQLDGLVNSLRGVSFQESETPVAGATSTTPSAAPPDRSTTSAPVSTQKHALRVRVSEMVSQAFLVKKVQPAYPDRARANHLQGLVRLRAVISPEGDVQELTLISGDPALVPSTLEAVKQWKYKPYLLQGQAVQVETQITVAYQLSH